MDDGLSGVDVFSETTDVICCYLDLYIFTRSEWKRLLIKSINDKNTLRAHFLKNELQDFQDFGRLLFSTELYDPGDIKHLVQLYEDLDLRSWLSKERMVESPSSLLLPLDSNRKKFDENGGAVDETDHLPQVMWKVFLSAQIRHIFRSLAAIENPSDEIMEKSYQLLTLICHLFPTIHSILSTASCSSSRFFSHLQLEKYRQSIFQRLRRAKKKGPNTTTPMPGSEKL